MAPTPRYNKVEILFKSQNSSSITKEEFINCELNFTGDFMIVTINVTNEIDSSTMTTNKVFHLGTVSAYKTYAE